MDVSEFKEEYEMKANVHADEHWAKSMSVISEKGASHDLLNPPLKIKRKLKLSTKDTATVPTPSSATAFSLKEELLGKKDVEQMDPSAPDEKALLEHLGEYIEEPFHIIESYFEGQHLERLVRHQIESYNHFVNYQIQRTIQMFNPVVIRSENDFIAEKNKYFLEVFISFTNFKLYPPQIHENNGATKMMLPQEAKLRNFTYASTMSVDVNIQYVVRNTETMETPKIIEKVLPKINIGKLPIMLKSAICVLTQNKHIQHEYTGECSMDSGGYFIIKGSEKTVLGQERAAENKIYCFDGKNTTKWNWMAEIKSVPDFKCISPKQIEMMIANKNNGFGHGIFVNIPRIKQPIELFVLFRALGVMTDKKICEYILLDISDKQQTDLLQALQASVIDSNKYITQEDALRHITAAVAYTPLNMDKETGARKKREFTVDVLNNDLFPHCQTLEQKLYLLGYMVKKLLFTSLGWMPPDDRDSYLNKRIELTGTLLNNLFRNYFNKLVKEMQKQIVREINNGSWRSMEDYENIINMTNIYKIMKSTTIENGINRALATGDFSIKQSNSSKVGVAQVLNRLTYVSSLSHLRRINTPLEKSGELIAPRKLHTTTWGFLCCAETPEGQSIGVVKNISYMAHVTIPTNSSSLYEYVNPQIIPLAGADPRDLHNKVKVFVNGCWLGVTNDPFALYRDMKDKKYRGIVNIYTSIVFDIKNMEIRICNDGGRLTRPVLKVRDNKAIITKDIIKMLENKEISWNDLLTNCKLDESVVEYIDPEEQNFAMIAMKCKHGYLQDDSYKFQYTHCEIHPSTIFGVLASCIPYPDHNQAPRNTYQCLGPDELVWMADGSRKAIRDVQIGEKVLTFHPETLEITETAVINQFVRPNEYPIYKLTTVTGREIIATEDHKFMTDQGWKTVGEMKADSSIKIGISMTDYSIELPILENPACIVTEETFINKMRELDVEESKNRKVSKIFNYANQLKTMGLLPLYENSPALPILCRIMGFLYADGFIDVLSRNRKSVARNESYVTRDFQCSFDFGTKNDAEAFENDVFRCGFSKNKIMEGTRTFCNKYDNRMQTHHTFTTIHNGVLPAFLISMGMSYGKKTETIRNPIPDWIMKTKEFGRQFIRGFQGGDGSKIVINKYRNCVSMRGTSQHIHPKYKDSLVCFMEQCVSILNALRIDSYMLKETSLYSERVKIAYQIQQTHNNLIRYCSAVGYAYSETKNNQSFKIVEYLKYKTTMLDKMGVTLRTMKKEGVIKPMSSSLEEDFIEKNNCLFMNIDSITKEPDGLISCIETLSENKSFLTTNAMLSKNCAMAKQAMGIYATNYDQRMDKTAYVLNYPTRPLVDTRLMNFIHLNRIPSGTQIHVAIMTHTGYNQEDSVLINKGSLDRGLFLATIYHTEKDEDKNIIRDEIIRCNPDKTKTKGIKFGNYSKLDVNGFIPENELVENRDVIIAKIIPIKENRNDPTKVIKYEDQSKTFRTTEETYIDKNYTGRNGDGYNFAKVRVRILRKPVLGDKFSSRHGQKGTAGNIIPECDMPFTKNGLRPDIIINPHAIPSRMTIGQLKETLLGKVLIELGLFGDGTSFGNLDVKTISEELQKLGYESYGNELMYNGLTGEQLETNIFLGPVFYQRLKHMVNDKQHSRSIGPMVNLTRQPAEGRSRDGGFRIGEMERDVMIAHGMSRFCRERLYDVSDKYSAHVCKKCGMIAAYNDGNKNKMYANADFSIHLCNTCGNKTDFAKVDIPYAYKLLSQELQTINVVPRIITE
jgi:DNA-directed RNA polymerase beta subunit/intein/homing endonuclease